MQFTIAQWRLPKRFVLIAMVFIGYVNFYGLHANIAMVVVDMTSMKTFTYENGTTVQAPEYVWRPQQKALMLGSFSYGRLIGPIGGILASRFGGGTLYGINTIITALITILSPLLLQLHFYAFVLATALTGTCESFAYASVSQLWSRWAPPDERAKFISISVIGVYAGPVVSYLIAGWILSTWKWPTLFYICGVTSFIWGWVWWFVVPNDPSIDKCISDEEKSYIEDKLNSVAHNERVVYPWKHILTCVPFWVACICKFSNGLGYTFCMMYLPQYIKDMNDIDIKQIGYISVIPMLGSVVSMPLGGCIFDYIRSNNILSVTKSHKLFISIAFFTGTLCFLIAGLWSNFVICVICISVFQFFGTFAVFDIQVLVLDLAPRYAAFMNATDNAFFTIAGFLTPIFVSFMVTDHSPSQWSICFITFSIIFTAVALISLKFISGQLQPWADYMPDSGKDDPSFEKAPPNYSDCT